MSSVLAIVLLAVMAVVPFLRRSASGTAQGYLLSDRETGTALFTYSTVATLIGGNTLVTFTAFVFQFGLGALWVFLGLSAGCVVMAMFASQISRRYNWREAFTVSELYGSVWGKRAAVGSALIIQARFISILLVQLIGGGAIAAYLTGLPYSLCIIVITAVVLFYLWQRGFQGVLSTDAFQFFGILVPAVVLACFLGGRVVEGLRPADLSVFGMGVVMSIVFFLFGMLTVVTAGDVWQRIFSARDVRQARWGLALSAVVLPLGGVAIAAIGITARLHSGEGIVPEEALIYGISPDLLGPVLHSLALVVVLSAIVSTIDTLAFASATSFTRDFLKVEEPAQVKTAKIFLVGVAVLVTVAGTLVQDIILVAKLLAGVTFALAPSVFALLLGGRSSREGVELSIAGGIILFVVAAVASRASLTVTPPSALAGAILGMAIGYIVSRFRPKHTPSTESEPVKAAHERTSQNC